MTEPKVPITPAEQFSEIVVTTLVVVTLLAIFLKVLFF